MYEIEITAQEHDYLHGIACLGRAGMLQQFGCPGSSESDQALENSWNSWVLHLKLQVILNLNK